jgi:hypothetical protein
MWGGTGERASAPDRVDCDYRGVLDGFDHARCYGSSKVQTSALIVDIVVCIGRAPPSGVIGLVIDLDGLTIGRSAINLAQPGVSGHPIPSGMDLSKCWWIVFAFVSRATGSGTKANVRDWGSLGDARTFVVENVGQDIDACSFAMSSMEGGYAKTR